MEVMAEAVGACLCNSEGQRLFKRDEEKTISDTFEFSVFMEIYQACWQNILQKDFSPRSKISQPDRRFLFRLAAQLGRADVDALAEELDAKLFFEWTEYWRIEPFGMEWHRAGLSSYVALAAAGGKPPPDFVDKFLPSYDPATTNDRRRNRKKA